MRVGVRLRQMLHLPAGFNGKSFRMNSGLFVLLVWIAMSGTTVVDASRILLLPFPWKSHVFEMTAIGYELVDRGHDLHIVLPPSYPDLKNVMTSPIKIVEYAIKEPDIHVLNPPGASIPKELIETIMSQSAIAELRTNVDGFEQFCSNMLSDEAMISKLRMLRFDLVIVDGFPCSRCNYVVPYRLDIPYVTLTTTYEPWLMGTPAIPSFVPFPLAEFFTERMTFIERLSNLFMLVDWSLSARIPYISDEYIKKYITDKPFRSTSKLASDSKLWLFDTDVVLDYPRPTMPHEINIGGLSTKPSEALPDDLLKVMTSAVDGAIIVSFGSFDVLHTEILAKLFKGFERLSQTVIVRSQYFENEILVPKNVKILKWLPQNDLLGHPNTRLFITHCGANGQFEAVYHGVPMLGFPIFGDQPYNARRAEYHGYGLYLDILNFTPDDLFTSIQRILTNQSFYDNIKTASAVFRTQLLPPRERAAFWVEQVLQNRVGHLRSSALDLKWYEYLMLDVFAVISGCFFLMLLSLRFLIRRVIQCGGHLPDKRKKD